MKKYKTGFTFGGGAAKCFAQLGAAKALAERGITPDIISGTSAGAMAGALLADGYTPDEILGFFKKVKATDLTDVVIPHTGISRPTKVQKLLEKHLRAKHFEDLKIPLYVVASDFDRGEPVCFSAGSLIEPVVASCCIPVVFTPMKIGGVNYVDGGLFQNLPASVIRDKCEKLIGINVNPVLDKAYEESIRSMAERAFLLIINSNTKADKQLCDLLIEPQELNKYALYDVNKSKEIFEIGYKATINYLDNLFFYKQ